MSTLNQWLSNRVSTHSPQSNSVEDTHDALTILSDDPLFDLAALSVPLLDHSWFVAVNTAIRNYSSTLDASHDYQHVRRVVANAHLLLAKEKKKHKWARNIDPVVVWVACMTLHIGIEQYDYNGDTDDQAAMVDDFLKRYGCPLPVRRQASYFATHVFFELEMANLRETAEFTAEYPAFRIIQDADRLDALGAVGVGRLLVCGEEGTRGGIMAIEEQLAMYPDLMKTETGRKIVEERYAWMAKEFLGTWKAETDTSSI